MSFAKNELDFNVPYTALVEGEKNFTILQKDMIDMKTINIIKKILLNILALKVLKNIKRLVKHYLVN